MDLETIEIRIFVLDRIVFIVHEFGQTQWPLKERQALLG